MLAVADPRSCSRGGLLNYLFTLGPRPPLPHRWSRVGVAHGPRARLRGAAALLLGWIFLTRPYDAAVWGLLGRGAPGRRAPRQAPGSSSRRRCGPPLGLLPLVALTLALNQRLTGSALEFPITVADPLDQFGFGDRRLMPGFGIIDYGPRLALESTGPQRLLAALLPRRRPPRGDRGGRRGVGAAAATAPCRTCSRLGLAFPVAYFAFFGTHISSLTARLSGPIYYIPAYVPLCALMAMAVRPPRPPSPRPRPRPGRSPSSPSRSP